MKSDLWGLGVIIHELACGERPWKFEFESAMKPREEKQLVPTSCDERSQKCLLLLLDSLLEIDWAKRPSAREVRGFIAALSSDKTEICVWRGKSQSRRHLVPRQIEWKLVEWRQSWYPPGLSLINLSFLCGSSLSVTDIEERGKQPPVFKCKCIVSEPLIGWGLFLHEGERGTASKFFKGFKFPSRKTKSKS
jgi:serine/threonine protein kinase